VDIRASCFLLLPPPLLCPKTLWREKKVKSARVWDKSLPDFFSTTNKKKNRKKSFLQREIEQNKSITVTK
jgi:hypothetical protein